MWTCPLPQVWKEKTRAQGSLELETAAPWEADGKQGPFCSGVRTRETGFRRARPCTAKTGRGAVPSGGAVVGTQSLRQQGQGQVLAMPSQHI